VNELYAPYSALLNLYSPLAIGSNNSTCSCLYGLGLPLGSCLYISLPWASQRTACPLAERYTLPLVAWKVSSTLLLIPSKCLHCLYPTLPPSSVISIAKLC